VVPRDKDDKVVSADCEASSAISSFSSPLEVWLLAFVGRELEVSVE
jgi:hypothetical protein